MKKANKKARRMIIPIRIFRIEAELVAIAYNIESSNDFF
jgi:hypothetical protein